MPIPKPRRAGSRKEWESSPLEFCEICGRRPVQKHHLRTRGARGPDTVLNRVCLCYACHGDAHNARLSRSSLIKVVAKREGITEIEIRKAIGLEI